jgi:hypothetical protein
VACVVLHVPCADDSTTLVAGIRRAFEEEKDVTCFLIVCFLRDRSADEAAQVLDDILPYVKYSLHTARTHRTPHMNWTLSQGRARARRGPGLSRGGQPAQQVHPSLCARS